MATSVHLSKSLLEAVDRRAKALGVSRNHLVVRALERELEGGANWSAGFFERLASIEPDVRRGVEDLLVAVRKARRSKPAREL